MSGRWMLLCRNLAKGYCYLPGGHVEFGEPAAAALSRELMEECGLRSKAGPLLLLEEGSFRAGGRVHHELNLVFHVKHPSKRTSRPPSIRSREPHIGFEWMKAEDLASIDFRPKTIRAWLLARRGSSQSIVPRETPTWLSSISR